MEATAPITARKPMAAKTIEVMMQQSAADEARGAVGSILQAA
jgi:hypothetical protein